VPESLAWMARCQEVWGEREGVRWSDIVGCNLKVKDSRFKRIAEDRGIVPSLGAEVGKIVRR